MCQQCKLTTVQQRWQWQRCSITVHTSVTAVTTDSGVTAVWQQCDNGNTGSAVTAVSTNSAVTAMLTLVWQWCAHHCESIGNWQRCHSTVSCHRCYTNVYITISVVSLPLLSQCCACLLCNRAVLRFSLLQRRAHRCLTAVGFLLCRPK